jgi:hypothetical protein
VIGAASVTGAGPQRRAELAVVSYGVCIAVAATDAAALARLAEHLPPGRRVPSSRAVQRAYALDCRDGIGRLDVDDRTVAEGAVADLVRIFASDVQLYVAEMAPHHVFVHAGAVGWGGRAIVVPGRSLSGKTTLVAELIRAGATYYSDEYAILDDHGRVHPYARTLSIRDGGPRPSGQRTVEDLGGRGGSEPLPVGLVVLTEYRADAVWAPRPLSAGQGALGLFANTVSARRRPAAALSALRHAVEHATVLGGVRGDAGVTATAVLQVL